MSNTNDTNAPGRLSLVELTKTFSNTASEVTAVDHINLDIHPGEFITLLGPSGCGKTTTLRMIAGFEDATQVRSCSMAKTWWLSHRTSDPCLWCSSPTRCSLT